MKTIYVDMDGVLSDFDRFMLEHTGRTLESYSTSQEGWDSVKAWPNLFALLEPTSDAEELVQGLFDLVDTSYRVEVLTAIPKIGKVPGAKEDKLLWINHYFPEFDAFNIGPLAEHKQYHCVMGDVLIDDKQRNIIQWDSMGGKGILHTSAKTTLAELTKYIKWG